MGLTSAPAAGAHRATMSKQEEARAKILAKRDIVCSIDGSLDSLSRAGLCHSSRGLSVNGL